ncbi:MAG: putative metallophosphoesterase [Syntrophorhabdus sp. PtaB.Bin184]|nr:MAG: putative metallophosphoesterase [Syntrophorhabdus sp. PtaB.Bin184]
MGLFFITFFTLYTALHAYVFIKTWYAFRFRPLTGCIIAFVLLFCVFMPLFVRALEQGGQESIARVFAYAGYIWMSAIFIFFVTSLVIDIGRLCVIVAASLFKVGLPATVRSNLALFLLPVVVSVFTVVYGYHEAASIRMEKVRIETSKLPPEIGKVSIVQVSDIHLGLVNREAMLKRVVAAIKEARPDMVVSTGDLVDGQINNINGLSDMLKDIKPRYGKYAIMGNHEFYAGVGVSEDFTRKAGFRMLRNEGITIEGIVNVAGVDDDAGHRSSGRNSPGERSLLERLPRHLFTIFLKHRPVVTSSTEGHFDIQLSGHTHGGQVYPFKYVTRISFPRIAGLYPLNNGSLLYVSRGTGTWGPPIRFLTPPEVTVIEVVRKK